MKEYKSFYKTVDGNEGQKCNYPTRLDTYGCGCVHDCKYCYAKSLLSFRGLWNPYDPSVADINKIEKKIKTLTKGTIVRLGGMTDCFQECEKEFEVTYKTIQLLNKYGIHYLIVTKSDLIASDKYLKVLNKNLAHIQITVTSTDDNLARQYENAPVTSKRLGAIEKLFESGFDVQVRLSPYIPEYVDWEVIKRLKCERVIIEFLRVNAFIKKTFELDFTKYTHRENGYEHLPLEEKIKLLTPILKYKQVSVCEDCSDAYSFWEKYVNYNPFDCCNLLNYKHDYIGNIELLHEKKTAFLSSPSEDKELNEKIIQWANGQTSDDVIISGFHSNTEKKALDVLLKKSARIILVMAKDLYAQCPGQFADAVKAGRMLILTPKNINTKIVTKGTALLRNQYVLDQSNSAVVGTATKNGMIETLLSEYKKTVIVLQ